MTQPAVPERYKHHRFPGEIINHGVWLYYRFSLSYRDVEELLEGVPELLISYQMHRHPPQDTEWIKEGEASVEKISRTLS